MGKWNRYPATWLIAAILLAPGIMAAQALKPQEIYQLVTPSVLTLKVLNNRGERFTASGFLALQPGIAITAWHSIHDAQHVYAIMADGTRVEVEGLVDKDEEHDLALVRVKATDLPLAGLSDATPTIGSPLYVMGAPKGFGFSIVDGLLSQVQIIDGFKQYQISCPLSTGNSGGPVLNELGEVIGVASWSRLDAQNVNFAVPVEYVRDLDVNRSPVDWKEIHQHAAEVRDDAGAGRLSEPDDDLAALRNYLKRAAGHKITVTVQEDGGNKSFSFIVPE